MTSLRPPDILITPASQDQIQEVQRIQIEGAAAPLPSEDSPENPSTLEPEPPPPPPKDHYDINDTGSLGEDVHESPSWKELSKNEKIVHVLKITGKILLVFALLYFFICSLDLLSVGLRILGGFEPNKLLRNDTFLQNPVIGLMCGILFTILVQSSSTTSSAVVGLVAGKIINIDIGIPMIMGANIGTSVTNTLFAMLQVDNKSRFRRAFAAATVHDMFNWLTTLVLLPIESITGYLRVTSRFLVEQFHNLENKDKKKKLKLLKALTEPLTKKIVLFNDKVVEMVANNKTLLNKDLSVVKKDQGTIFDDSTLSDKAIGSIVVCMAFVILLTCLFLIVKTLESILKGKMAIWIRKFSNANLPYCPFLTEYLLIVMGAAMTFLVQSSSAFTSTLPPLVAVKAIAIERAYALTLGSNLGTTTTAIIAAMALTKNITEGLQIALCHFLFNLTGILLFFPVPYTRFPIGLSKFLGNTTAQYRWFAIVYVLLLFVLLPLLFMSLAFAGSVYVIVVATLFFLIILFVTVVNYLQNYPKYLPKVLHTWDWLPVWMRSLEPYDKLFQTCKCCRKLNRLSIPRAPGDEETVNENSSRKEPSMGGDQEEEGNRSIGGEGDGDVKLSHDLMNKQRSELK